MLGDFRYCSSSSESSDGEYDSDSSMKSDDYLDKLIAEKKMIEEKIKEHEAKLKNIQSTLKKLNDERKNLFMNRNELVTSSCDFVGPEANIGISEISFSSNVNRVESEEQILPNTSEPLNLDPDVRGNDNEEEFDSDNEN